MAVGSIYRLTLLGRSPSQADLVNVLHYRALTPTVFQTQCEDLLEAFLFAGATGAVTEFQGCFAPNISFYKAIAAEVSPGVLEYSEQNYPGLGTRPAGDTLPPQCSGVISWRTGNRGRSFRGRTYIWPTIEGDQGNGQWTQDYLNALEAFGDAALSLGDNVVTANYELVVWSSLLGVGTKVTSYLTPPIVHTQKRRVTGSGS